MKLTSPQCYKVIRFALEKGEFKQIEVHRATGVAFSWVNKVVNWMVDHQYAARRLGGYKLIAPAALAESLALFRRMEKLAVASFQVNESEGELAKLLAQNNAVLCLTTALGRYDDYFRDPAIHVYGNSKLVEGLKQLPPGRTKITVYDDDLKQESDFEKDKRMLVTKKTRTIVDLLCSQRSYAADQLIKKMWGRG